MDSAFPDRLLLGGYRRTIEFVQYLFSEYAQAGLTCRSDKEVALLGLLQRMQTVLRSEYFYGVFDCFASRLLLWRIEGTTEYETASALKSVQQLPSWSWMSHDHIKFFPEEDIDVLVRRGSIDSNRRLQIGIFDLFNSQEKQEDDQHIYLQNDNVQTIGELWFDRPGETYFKSCAVIGRSIQQNELLFVLVVMEIDTKRYRRLGAGWIKSRFVSNVYIDGIVV